MTRRITTGHRIAAMLASLLLARGCSRLALFDAVVPKDRGGVRVARGVAYGSDPRQRLDVYPDVSHVGVLLALARPFRGRAPVLDDVVRFVSQRTGPQAP